MYSDTSSESTSSSEYWPFKLYSEQIDEVVPFVDQVDGHAAAQRFAGAVHRAVIDARPPVGQVARAEHPCAVGFAVHPGGQPFFQRQHRAAPAHRRGHVGFLPGGQQGGKVGVRLLRRKDRLFNKQRPGPPAQAGQHLGVQTGGVGDKRQVVPRQRGGVVRAGKLRVQPLGHTGAQRARQIAAQRVGAQRDPALLAQRVQIVQVPGADGSQPHKQGGQGGHTTTSFR